MGYFDGLTDAAFKKDPSGKTLYYPWGILGSGFIIESEDKTTEIRRFTKRMYIVMLPTVIFIQSLAGFWLNALLFPIYVGWYYFAVKKITAGLSKTNEKLRLSESYRNSAKSHNLPTLIILELISVGFVAIGVWMILAGQNSLMAYLVAGFFGMCAVAIAFMIDAKLNEK